MRKLVAGRPWLGRVNAILKGRSLRVPDLLAVGLLAAALLGLATLLRLSGSDQQWVQHTVEVQASIARLQAAVLAAESGQRGYLLTEDDHYLELYRSGVAEQAAALVTLRERTADNPQQQQRLELLDAKFKPKFAELAETVRLTQNGQRAAALTIVRSDLGRRLTAEATGIFRDMDRDEAALLARRLADAQDNRLLAALTMTIALLALALLAWRVVAQQRRYVAELRAANATLDARVAERTARLEVALQRISSMADEVHHRAGNGLSMVAAFLSLQARDATPEAAAALEEARERVAAVASAQRRLRADWTTGEAELGAYLGDIMGDMRRAMGNHVTLEFAAPEAPIRRDFSIAVSIGIILGELVTNALKHAFNGGGGAIRVRLDQAPQGMLLEVSDDGRGMAPDSTDGLGRRVLNALVATLDARLDSGPAFASAERPGTRWTLTLPAVAC